MKNIIIILLISYSFHLKLKLVVKSNSFSHLYETCEKTESMISDIKTMVSSNRVKSSKIEFYKKNNVKLLYNYRSCVSALNKKIIKSANRHKLVSQ